MLKYEVCSSKNQKVKFHFEKSKFPRLIIFFKCWKIYFFHNFVPNFHDDGRRFKETSNMKAVDRNEI